MKYHLIFYISKKTSYSEKAVKKRLKTIGGEAHRIVNATTPALLGEEVGRGLRTCPLTVIVGGLGSVGDDNLATVLSRVFSNSSLSLNNMRRLTNGNGATGYVIRYKNQILLALPDSPEDIGELCSDGLLSYISEKTTPGDKKPEADGKPEPDNAAEQDDGVIENDDEAETPTEDDPAPPNEDDSNISAEDDTENPTEDDSALQNEDDTENPADDEAAQPNEDKIQNLNEDDAETPSEDESQTAPPEEAPLPKSDTATQPSDKSVKLQIKTI